MKIIIVGGTGTIGKAVAKELGQRHQIIIVGFESGDLTVDIKEAQSIINMYQTVGDFDAVVSTLGKLEFAPLTQMTNEQYYVGLNDKLMGQVNLVLHGLDYINDRGSFTLTSGILSQDPIPMGTSASMVNAALDAFVKAAAIETPRGIRINTVSPTVVLESYQQYKSYFYGFEPVPAARVALAFSKSVEGGQTGQVFKAGY